MGDLLALRILMRYLVSAVCLKATDMFLFVVSFVSAAMRCRSLTNGLEALAAGRRTALFLYTLCGLVTETFTEANTGRGNFGGVGKSHLGGHVGMAISGGVICCGFDKNSPL